MATIDKGNFESASQSIVDMMEQVLTSNSVRVAGGNIHAFFKQIEAPVTDELLKRVETDRINYLIECLLKIGLEADATKRRTFYGTTIRPKHYAEFNTLEYCASQYEVYTSKTDIPSLESLPPEIRHDLVQRIRRLHHTLGLLSEIFEATTLDLIITNRVLDALHDDPTGGNYFETIQTIIDSFNARHKAEVKSATAKDDTGTRNPDKLPEPYSLHDVISEEGGDMSYYLEGLVDTVGLTLDEVRHRTYDKLNKRYHQGQFSQSQAEERKDKNQTQEGEVTEHGN